MTIRKQLSLSIGISLVVALAVAAYAIHGYTKLQRMNATTQLATSIVSGVFELNLLAHEYLLFETERPAVQWEKRSANLGELLERQLPEEELNSVWVAIREDHEAVEKLFVRLTGLEPSVSGDSIGYIHTELRRRLTAQLLMYSRSMVTDAERLYQRSVARRERIFRTTFYVFMSAFALMVLGFLTSLFLFLHRIALPLEHLQYGTSRVAAGDFEYRVRLQRRDEVGRLASSFNHMTQELKVHRENLEETIASLEGFCYNIAHDLRAPLRAIHSFAQILREDYEGTFDEQGKEFTLRIHQAAGRMDQLINDLLEYGRLTHMEIPCRPVALKHVLEKALDEMHPAVTAARATVEIAEPLPWVIANETVLHQVVLNLISNAIKFQPKGNEPKLKIWAQRRRDTVRLHFQDNGIGIPEQYRQRIFRVFERLHSVETYSGTGIGLAIVAKGMERMGGEAGITSSADEGAIFWVELPGAAPGAA